MIGIICATTREATPLLARLEARPLAGTPLPCWTFVLPSGEAGIAVRSGMGPEAAGRATDWLIEQHAPDRVLNLGLCGALQDHLPVQELLRIREAVDGDDPRHPSWPGHPGPWEELPAACLVTTAQPVFDPDRRRELARLGEVVDMEGAAIAARCAAAGVPCVLLKGVSDLADGAGRERILENIDSVSAALAETVAARLHAQPRPTARTSVKQLLRFTKVEHTVFSLPLLFAGAWLGAGRQLPDWQVLAWIVVAGLGARILGMSMNRILDRHLDARNPRTAGRELPSKAMSVRTALGVALAGLVAYLGACAALGPATLLLSPVPALLLIGYSLLKRFTPLCHFGIGLCLALAPAGAAVAVTGRVEATTPLVLLCLFTFCWMSAFDIIYALQDLESDRRQGVKSLPAALGARGAQRVAALVHGVAAAATAALLISIGGSAAGWVVWTVLVAALVAAYWPTIPLPFRFFPLSAIAGVAGGLLPLL